MRRLEDKLAVERAARRIQEVLEEELGVGDPRFLVPHALGDVFAQKRYKAFELNNNVLQWSVDSYVASTLKGIGAPLARLHAHLKHNTSPGQPYDFEYGDRYGMAFADEAAFKTMALQTQNVTYLVLLRKSVYDFNDPAAKPSHEWEPHLRMCTPSRNSRDFARPALSSLSWLADVKAMGATEDYSFSPDTNEYFRYKDARDRGFLCSVSTDLSKDARSGAKDSMGSFAMLEYVLQDLMAHVSCLKPPVAKPLTA